jgi:transposase
MRVLYECCCGLDIHKKCVVACLLRPSAEGSVDREIRTFSTMTNERLALCDWLGAEQCTPVVMESAAAFWRPSSNLLEGQLELLVVNAAHVKAAHVKAVRPCLDARPM